MSSLTEFELVMLGPNITGRPMGQWTTHYDDVGLDGAFYEESVWNGTRLLGYGDWRTSSGYASGLDAELSSSVYGNAQTVQPSSLRILPCIRA